MVARPGNRFLRPGAPGLGDALLVAVSQGCPVNPTLQLSDQCPRIRDDGNFAG